MSNKIKVLVALSVVVLIFAGWIAWAFSGSHGEGVVESHQHHHVHGQGIDHGHEHENIESVSHSHPHRHDRHHHGSIEFPGQEGLTEIGHSHDASGDTTHFWAKLIFENNDQFALNFFASQESDLNSYAPPTNSLNALIFNGGKLEGEARFEKSDENYIALMPSDFLVLPTHVLKFEDLEFGDLKLDAVLPISN